jgi:hypothetical protein
MLNNIDPGSPQMILKRFTTEQMSSVSAAWLDPQQLRPLFEADDQLKIALPKVQTIHSGLFVYLGEDKLPAELVALIEHARELDARHDDLVRGIFLLLGAMIELAKSDARKTELRALRVMLFPIGIALTLKPYAEEMGAAVLLEKRLKDTEMASLKELRVIENGEEADLLSLVLEMISTAKELGALDRKIEDEERAVEGGTGPSRSDAQHARNNWIRMVREVNSLLNLLSVSKDVVDKIMAPVLAAEKDAERRYALKKG